MTLFEVDEADQLRSVEEQLIRRFEAKLPPQRVSAEIRRVLSSYGEARIRTFVPVLVQHDVIDALRHSPA